MIRPTPPRTGANAFSALALAMLTGVTAHAQQVPDQRNLVVAAVDAASPEKKSNQRVALVIGNAGYKEGPLTNPVNDARAIAQVLRETGFAVTLREDADFRSMLAALREFGDVLRKGGVGLFYYAGHGMQIKGRNYLIPVGSSIEREDEVAYAAVDAQAVLDKMDAAGNGTNIMILDACRNNPFARSSRNAQQGLALMEAPVGTLVAFATAPGSVASDGAGQNGLYTQHLLQAMRQNGAKVEDVFKQVRSAVRRDSQGRQIPWESTSLEGDFYFIAPAPVVVAAPAPAAPPPPPPRPAESPEEVLDRTLWDMVRESSQPLEIRAYLNRFPGGRYTELARARLATLSQASVPAAPVVAAIASTPTPPAVAAPPAAPAPQPAVVVTATAPPPTAPAAPARPAAATVAALTPATPAPPPAAAPAAAPVVASAAPSPAVRPPTAPTQTAAVTRPAASGSGITVGDRWNFQVVDKYKQEVVNNFSLKIASVAPDGKLRTSDDGILSPQGNRLSGTNADRVKQVLSAPAPLIPMSIQPGHVEPFQLSIHSTGPEGGQNISEWTGTLKVIGREKVRVPAGEFDAVRLEREASVTRRWLNRAINPGFGTQKMTIWYAPEVKYFVALEEDLRFGAGAPSNRTRTELTSFEVSPALTQASR